MDLRQRLVLLRRQSGAEQATPAPPPSPTPDSVAARLQRLGGVPAETIARSSRDAHVASLLQKRWPRRSARLRGRGLRGATGYRRSCLSAMNQV